MQLTYIATVSVAGKHKRIVQRDLSGLHRRARKAMNKLIAREAARADCLAPIYTDSGKQSGFYGAWGLTLNFETFTNGRHYRKAAGYSITCRSGL
jgi:hypothetical protein